MADSGSSSLHSSRASITITVEICADWSGLIRNFCICSSSDSWITSGLDWRRGTSKDLKLMYFCASWKASVGKMSLRLLRSSTPLEQKNEAPKKPWANILSAIVCAMADFPVPASPLSQKTGDPLGSLAQCSISFKTASRVPFKQLLRSPWWYPASLAQQQPFRTEDVTTEFAS